MLKVEAEPGVGWVGLEANCEEAEAEVGEGDGEPGDQLVLESSHPTRQQRLRGWDDLKLLDR